MKDNQDCFVSLIIPAYKKEAVIEKELPRIEKVLQKLDNPFEIIVVVDGTVDKTLENAKKVKSKHISVYGYPTNRGKGYAIRYGMVRSKGDIVGFIDSGMDINPNGLSIMLDYLQWHKADIIVGSKLHPVSRVKYPPIRQIISFFSQLLIQFLFGLHIRDTQVGLKFFRRAVIEDVMPRLLVKQFAFDIEVLVVAYHLGYRKIMEAPVDLQFNFDTSVVSRNLYVILLYTLWDTLAIFYRLKIRRYYDDGNKREWKYDPELNFRVNVG